MQRRCIVSILAMLALLVAGPACTTGLQPAGVPTPEPTLTPEPTETPMAQAVSLEGLACPDGFQREQNIRWKVELAARDTLTLTLGSTPSIPCGWQALEIEDDAILHQVDHRSQWPAEGVTPMPGAPGVEIWVLEALEEGEGSVSLDCTCLGEEGVEQELRGTFVLDVKVH